MQATVRAVDASRARRPLTVKQRARRRSRRCHLPLELPGQCRRRCRCRATRAARPCLHQPTSAAARMSRIAAAARATPLRRRSTSQHASAGAARVWRDACAVGRSSPRLRRRCSALVATSACFARSQVVLSCLTSATIQRSSCSRCFREDPGASPPFGVVVPCEARRRARRRHSRAARRPLGSGPADSRALIPRSRRPRRGSPARARGSGRLVCHSVGNSAALRPRLTRAARDRLRKRFLVDHFVLRARRWLHEILNHG